MAGALQNVTKFAWTEQKARAAVLLAEDELTDEEIAAEVKVARQSVARWKQHPEFQSRIAQHVHDAEQRILTRGIARRVRRVQALQDRWDRLQRVIEQRAADPRMADIPGGTTGLLVIEDAELRMVKDGETEKPVLIPTEVAVDTGLLKELREHEKQAAVELGQWTEKREHSIPNIDELIAAEMARLAGAGQAATTGPPAGHPDARK